MSNEYEVGYCKTPVHTRFKPGQSGNPKGRPKAQETDVIGAFKDVFLTRETVLVNGKKEHLSGLELYFKMLKQEMLKLGNHKDRRIMLELLKSFKIMDRFMNLGLEFDDIMNDPRYYDPEGEFAKEKENS